MARQFNILATTERINEERAGSELWMLLRAAGDEAPKVERMGIWGILVAKTKLDPAEAVAKMKEEFIKKPEGVQVLFRVIPIQRLVPSSLDDIVSAAVELGVTIPKEAKYRITVEKRRVCLGSHEIIDAIADKFSQKVDLENPDWVILIETAGKQTGVSVVRPISILNVQKERVRLSAEAKKRSSLDDKPA